jgi:osmotically-inducible protein OsmY
MKEQPMRISAKHRQSNFVYAGVAAAALGLAVFSSVFASQPGSDTDVASRVQQALQSDPVLDSKHIDVGVDHGDVVLNGFVQDNRALVAAGQVARKAAGDRKVVNHLTIKQNYPNPP